MKIVVAGGGTGGHVFPALTVAQEFRNAGHEVLMVGTAHGLEATLAPKRGFELALIDIHGFTGQSLSYRFGFCLLLVRSVWQSLRLLRRFRPDVVLGVGGYVSAPVLVAARVLGIPYVLHEQNAIPGAVNRLMGRWARCVCLSFPDESGIFGRSVLTGNPVRGDIFACPEIPGEPPALLVFGGSQGARALNQAMVAALPLLETWRGRLRIRHQTGAADLETVRAGYRNAGWDEGNVVPFIDDMAGAYAEAQLVLCRAGATTLAELAGCGRPAVLVPFPFAAHDHQMKNARALEKRGAALVLPQAELAPERLAALIGELLEDQTRLRKMGAAIRALARPDAAQSIVRECLRCTEKKRATAQ